MLTQLVHRGTPQGHAHRTVRSHAVLPVRYDLTRRGTVRICTKEKEERKNRGRREGGEREEEEGQRKEERKEEGKERIHLVL